MTDAELTKFAADTIEHARRFSSICVYWNIKHAKPCKTSTDDYVEDGNRRIIGVYAEDSQQEWVEEDIRDVIEQRQRDKA